MPTDDPTVRVDHFEKVLVAQARLLIRVCGRFLKGPNVNSAQLESAWKGAAAADIAYQAALDALDGRPPAELTALLDVVLEHTHLMPDDVLAAARRAYVATRPPQEPSKDQDGNPVAGHKVHWATARSSALKTGA
jgi:hypothetical protein